MNILIFFVAILFLMGYALAFLVNLAKDFNEWCTKK